MATSGAPTMDRREPLFGFSVNRWWIFVASIIAMMAIANLQYAWTLFTTPLTKSLHTELAAVQVAFSTFVLCETWLVPFEGWIVDHLGPRLIILCGGVLVGLAWVGSGLAQNVISLDVLYALGGVGAGAVYGACVGNTLKWFPDRRGLCAGAVAGSYGVGTAVTIIPISNMIEASGYRSAFIVFGFIQGIVVMICALFITRPPRDWVPAGWDRMQERISTRIHMSTRNLRWHETLRQPSFWALYFVMTLMAFTGLVVTAQLKPIAQHYHVDKVVVLLGMTTLVMALLMDRIVNGLTRPFWGWVSDHIGRENAMFIAFGIQTLTILGWVMTIGNPVLFVVLTGLAYFSWGEIFSLFPATVGDLFGKANATTNYGMLYTAKGLASIFAGPVAALAAAGTTGWIPVFYAMAACSGVAAILALVMIKPIARRAVAYETRVAIEVAGS
jgi:OFA family oxalate/formate antiporter-like MFS transporter